MGDAGDNGTADRPSFTSFWKRSKEEESSGKEITFVSAAPGQTASSSTKADEAAAAQAAKEKALARRAQVRRAQIQHRQRKANYIKQLELDVTRFRDMIAQVEKETVLLRRDNEGMKMRLRSAGIRSPRAQRPQQPVARQPIPEVPPAQVEMTDASPYAVPPPTQMQAAPSLAHQSPGMQAYDHVNLPPPSATTDMFADIDVSDLTVTLSMDETMGTPTFKISSSSSSSSGASDVTVSSPRSEAGGQMSPQQEQMAVNFILALEHICWAHFKAGDFHEHGDPAGSESCHTLMASTFCMASAPESVYKERKGLRRWIPSKSPTPVLSWQSSGPSLKSLHGLASSLNPGDKELTPVQVWFELASLYPTQRILDASLLESLKREFVGAVRCVKYGATVERRAFESIVGRVVGFAEEPASPMAVDA